MNKYRKKPVVVEAITFDELVAYGREHCGSHLHNNMPWSFDYKGQPITHENDDCYLIPTLEGTMKFNRGDMLITGIKGELYPCKLDIFEATYELADYFPPPIVLSGDPRHDGACVRAVQDIAERFGLHIVHEASDFRPDSMSYVKPSELAARLPLVDKPQSATALLALTRDGPRRLDLIRDLINACGTVPPGEFLTGEQQDYIFDFVKDLIKVTK